MRLPSSSYLALYNLCVKNPLFNEHEFLRFIENSYKFNYIERHRYDAYSLFSKNGIPVPKSIAFNSKEDLLKNLKPNSVVKFETNETLGPQTLVLTNKQNYKMLYETIEVYPRGIVQEFVEGKEFTVTVIVGSENWIPIGSARDYKRQFDNNDGLNTFGLGSISPCAIHPDTYPTIDSIVNVLRVTYGYSGLLSCQFIANEKLWLLECNTRLCDPEFQSMAELLSDSMYKSIIECVNNQYINQVRIEERNAVTVSLIHEKWPEKCDRVELEFLPNDFTIYRNPGLWDRGTYYGSITHSGSISHTELAQEIYTFLKENNTSPYRYRTDIGK